MALNANNGGAEDVKRVNQPPAPHPTTGGPQNAEYSPCEQELGPELSLPAEHCGACGNQLIRLNSVLVHRASPRAASIIHIPAVGYRRISTRSPAWAGSDAVHAPIMHGMRIVNAQNNSQSLDSGRIRNRN